MKKTRIVWLRPDRSYAGFLSDMTTGSRKLYNTANYIVRNLRSAMLKASRGAYLSSAEEDVVMAYRCSMKAIRENEASKFRKNVSKASKVQGLKAHRIMHTAVNDFMPDLCFGNVSRVCSYYFLDEYLKDVKNEHYYSLPAQVNQQVLRKLAADWRSYFAARKEYFKDKSAFTGIPKPPKYKKDKATATFTKQVSGLNHVGGKYFLSVTGCSRTFCIGSSADFDGMKYIRSEIVPFYGGYRICVTFEDDSAEISIPKNPSKVLGVDHGVGNFMACLSNLEDMPALLYKGGYIKSINQWFNKRKAELVSSKTKGFKTTHKASSHALDVLSRNRDNRFRDYFYKASHHLCRKCKEYGIEVIVVGNTKLWKQESDIGKASNQNFVSIPYYRFGRILKCVAGGYGIAVVFREESYTSQSSFADKDFIPVYGVDDFNVRFSGIREKKAFTLSNGTVVNADINGGGNIARKEYPEAFKAITRGQAVRMMRNIETVKINDIYPDMKVQNKKPYRKKDSRIHAVRHHDRLNKKFEFRIIFTSKPLKGLVGVCSSSRASA